MKKLITFLPQVNDGGVEKNFFSTIKNLKKSGIKLFVICCSKKKFYKKLKINDNTGIFQLDKFPLQAKLIFSFLFLIYYNFRKKYPILSFQGNVYAIIASKIINCKIYIRLNSHPNFHIKSYIKKKIFIFFYKMADKIIVNSKEIKKTLKYKYNLNSNLIYNELDRNNIINKSRKNVRIKFSNNYPIIISVGRLDKNKNHIFLIEAFNALRKSLNYNLIILGSGNENQHLLNKINEYQLSRNIKIINYKDNPYPYMKISQFIVLPSKIEGYPNVLLEAGVLGKTIISNNISGPREIIGRDERGFLFDTKSYSKFFNVLNKIKNKKLNNSKVDNLKRYIKNYHSSDHSNKYINLIFK